MTSSQPKPSSNSIDLIIAKLGEKLDLTSEQIADVLWLALEFQKIEASSLGQKSNPEPELNLGEFNTGESPNISDFPSGVTQGSNPSNQSETDFSSEQIKSTDLETSPQEATGDVYPPSTAGDSSSLKLGVPDAPSIREPLTLARAFSPLMRRVPSNRKSIIDEAATVKRIAEERICIPVLQAELEPWLDLALVIDESHSMLIWGHTIRELKKMLKNYGIFRDVRIWGLQPDEAGENLQFFSRLGSDKRLTKPQELIDPTGRRLILIVSDCVSDIWRKGMIFPVLKAWTQKQPLAILQMLPEWMWDSTALNLGISVSVTRAEAIFEPGEEWGTKEIQITVSRNIDDSFSTAKSRSFVEEVPSNIKVPVYFVTDRNRKETDSEAIKVSYGGDRNSESKLEYGLAKVSIPAERRMGYIQRPKWWKLEFREDVNKHIVLLNLENYDREYFQTKLREDIKNSIKPELLLFIHGYNVSFHDAASLRHIIFAAPDIDAGIFKQLARNFATKADSFTLYASSKDKALQASKAVNGNPRAGDSGEDLVIVDGVDTIDASLIDTGFMGHSYFGDNRSVISDIFYLLKQDLPPNQRACLDEMTLRNLTYWLFKA